MPRTGRAGTYIALCNISVAVLRAGSGCRVSGRRESRAQPGAWPVDALSNHRAADAIACAFAEIPSVLALPVFAAR